MKKFDLDFKRTFFILFLMVLIYGCREKAHTNRHSHTNDVLYNMSEKNTEFAVAAPPFSEGIFPCSDCHNYMETNPQRRVLEMHEDIVKSFHHDSENRWCLDCHDISTRDSLRLASGKLLNFAESYNLCGQCHGDKLRDWKAGIHGKRIGEWNGRKQYFLCVHCHDPHAPRFKKIKPLPPPNLQ